MGPKKTQRRAHKRGLRRVAKASLKRERRRRKKMDHEDPRYVDLGGEA